jgi:uncharacterized protein YhdP
MRHRKRFIHYYVMYPLAIIVSLIILLVGLASFFLLNIHNYQTTIKNLLVSSTGYNVNFSKINGSFNLRFQPAINIDNIDISDIKTHHQFLHINNLKLSVSYRSLSLGKIVLSQIKLDGMDLSLNYDKDYNLSINGEIVSNLKSKSKSSFDFERFLLELHRVDLSNLNLSFINQMYDLNPINLRQVNFNFINTKGLNHNLTLKTMFGKSEINSELKFQGKSLSDISNWKSGELNISDHDNKNHNINLNANVLNGNLEYLNLRFNSNLHQLFALNNPVKGKTDLLGEIQINKNPKGVYEVSGNDLTINTESGSILNHASISGGYTLYKGGAINLSKVDLDGVSGLNLYQFSDRVNLGGYFESINFSWGGNLLSPEHMLLNTHFNDIVVNSRESTIPSINNINGNLNLESNSGTLYISLKSSKFDYPNQLVKPIIIESLNATTNWVVESNLGIVFNLQNANLQTKDFTLNTSGKYYSESNIVDLKASIDKIKISDTTNYMPKNQKVISDFIKSAMTNGSLSNLRLSINGEADKIPFNNGGGKFSYSESFSDVTLKFAPSWGAVTHVNGNLTAQNQAVKVNINSGRLNNFNISKTSSTVSDFMADNPTIDMDGYGFGSTSDFIDYLKTTPLKSKLSYQPQQLIGKSEVAVKLELPIITPDKLKLSGKWSFINNDIDFGSKVPYISNLNGILDFTKKGIIASNLSANALDSEFKLSILDDSHYQLLSPNLDYVALGELIGIPKSNILSGRAATLLDYDVTNKHISISSNLQGVKFNAPEPLNKNESEIKQLTLNFNQNFNQLNINYGNTLYALVNMDDQMKFKSAKVGLGTSELNIKYNNNVPLTINTSLKNLYITKWTDFYKQLSSSRSASGGSNIYPIQIQLKMDALWVNNYNIDGGSIDVAISANKVVAGINMPDVYGDLIYQKNKLWLNLDKLLISKENFVDMQNESRANLNTTKTTIPDIFIKIKNFYVQNNYFGELNARALQRNNNLYIESATLNNFSSKTTFRVIDHRLSESKEYTELRLRTQIKDYGATINKLNIGDNLKAGNGVFDLGLKWRGGIANFGIKKTLGYATLNIKNGEFIHVNPGLFGTLLGVVSLNSFTNVGGSNLNTFFGKGFSYTSWDMKVDIIRDQLKIENLKLVSDAASISSFGTLNLNNNTVDSYLTVEPRLGTAVATTAGIVTLNPIIGGIVYLGQALIGNPVNKALSLSYHITGDVTNPNITNFDLSDQIENNFLSTTNILSNPSSIFDVEVNK